MKKIGKLIAIDPDTHNQLRSSLQSFTTKLIEIRKTLAHLGWFFIAFVIVVLIFMLKEGRFTPKYPQVVPSPVIPNAISQPSDIPIVKESVQGMMDKVNNDNAIASSQAKLASNASTLKPQDNSTLQKLDLQGPWVCSYQVAGDKTEAFIQNKSIKVISTSNLIKKQMLIKDDCMYNWQGSTGSKQCDIGQYLQLFEMASASGLIDLNQIIQSQVGNAKSQDAVELIKSCKKIAIIDSIFAIPQGVTWTETEATAEDSTSSIIDLLK